MTTSNSTLDQLSSSDEFIGRHIGPDATEQKAMLAELGVESLDQLVETTLPESIRLGRDLNMEDAVSEVDALAYLKKLEEKNTVNRSYIGMGYHGTHVPHVILRNVFENPGWYTAYTPYQPEISQGRLEGLLNFQQMVMDLSGMDLANASLLDEATAAAEAMALCKRSNKLKSNKFFVADDVHPQTLDVIKTRAEYFGWEVIVGNPATDLANHEVFGVQLQYPGTYGDVADLKSLVDAAKAQKAMVSVAADPLALILLKSPGELGADVVVGNTQRFGVPMGFGGPHAAYMASSEKLKRSVPGRIIGVSVDSNGNPALRLAMQTREQHIRRDKATSNICTAQALLANMAGFYAVYHGPQGLKRIAEKVLRLTSILAKGLELGGVKRSNATFFDCVTVEGIDQAAVNARALAKGCNLRLIADGRISINLDETSELSDVADLLEIVLGADHGVEVASLEAQVNGNSGFAAELRRDDNILSHPIFNTHHSESEMMRYLKKLENKDYSLVHGMIPLGSCTMKLNAAAEMMPVTWNGFSNMHPFAPRDQAEGYMEMIRELEAGLAEITGYDAVCMQPNSGAQGEYAGLLAIRKYQEANGEGHRTICLIPSSAHGTNPASAAMMGMKVVVVKCDESGNIDVADLYEKAEQHKENLSCLIITYPSTHGVYEESVVDICAKIHEYGGQVYLDGANMNAQVGLTTPGFIGSDVSHLNLHKTFAIPHGGGGPGMGPIGVKKHLAPFVAGHAVSKPEWATEGNGAVAAAPYGSASILLITWMYVKMLGKVGLKKSTEVAVLNANYLASKLAPHYEVLYRGRNGRVAHECIIDIRPLKEATGVSEEDIAKRLMDYGFHAPTMSFPVAGTLMIEPTESEPKAELDRFIEAMVKIRGEIDQVVAGEWPADNNPLCKAPHTMVDITGEWNRPYSREVAVFPTAATRDSKYWPTANRVDNTYGDRHFICSCPSIEEYMED
ncbi:aminomethyl-transferring glycine dehydrogenase [Pelagibaculum spongiae]|uniref:Glycine dehydrogenase (decarboxylating) n=1 Tax=Pelagibaculum spongiae TaxID=2080658 RepID=A0A2V1GRS4_9GAMM|nr:aminomethyl-transferring glycine dehydrogenase [Pelagibaculum spongiae]PVZ63467.1 glycine dehydrogenase (aminomethyl-transferring) [Pelagibaculum spongiae]